MNIPTLYHPTGKANFYIITENDGVAETEFAFSYSTCIGVQDHGARAVVIAENEWGTTTGRHLNWLTAEWGGTKADRVPHDELLEVVTDA